MAETTENIEGLIPSTPAPIVAATEVMLWEFYDAGDHARALEVCQGLLEMRPRSARLWALKGHLHREMGSYGPALSAGQRAIELDERDPDALLEMGLTLIEMRKPVEGVELIRAVFELGRDPSKPPSEQTLHVIKAGAILEGIQKGIALVREDSQTRS